MGIICLEIHYPYYIHNLQLFKRNPESMEPEFITYQKFNDVALANELAELLENHNVKYFLEEESQSFDPTFSYANSREYVVKVQPSDFEQVNVLLKNTANDTLGEVESDYYLLSFNNNELMEILAKADEWNAFDVQLARKLLAERGHAISDKEIANLEEDRIAALKTTEPSQGWWIFVGYVFAAAAGVLGFFIGWHLWTYKKTLPNGEMIYSYSEKDRKQGMIIFYLSFIGLAIAFGYKMLPAFTSDY
jgi:hypothetical protein